MLRTIQSFDIHEVSSKGLWRPSTSIWGPAKVVGSGTLHRVKYPETPETCRTVRALCNNTPQRCCNFGFWFFEIWAVLCLNEWGGRSSLSDLHPPPLGLNPPETPPAPPHPLLPCLKKFLRCLGRLCLMCFVVHFSFRTIRIPVGNEEGHTPRPPVQIPLLPRLLLLKHIIVQRGDEKRFTQCVYI